MTSLNVISETNFCHWGLESPPFPEEYRDIAAMNTRLDKDVSPFHLTESLLEQRHQDLETLKPGSGAAYWLTYARLTELALYCCGTYADAGEFTAAGDLLINPRLVRVYIRGREDAVTKDRHLPLSAQFRDVADTTQGVIQWLKHNTIVRVEKEPLLCLFYQSLENSGCFRRTYLNSVDSRMKRIADTIAFLAAGNINLRPGPCSDGRPESISEKAFLESKLCRFGLDHFRIMGDECRRVLVGETIVSHFLIPSEERLNVPVSYA